MTQDGPGDSTLFQLVHRDLTRESTVWLVEHVLGGDFDTFAEVLTGKEQVERWRGNDNLFHGIFISKLLRGKSYRRKSETRTDVGVKLSIVQVVDNILDGLDVAIPLEVSVQSVDMLVLTARLVTYILKLPPTKNWRVILNTED